MGNGYYQRIPAVDQFVHEFEGKFYFWNSELNRRIGPYDNRAKASKALDEYCERWIEEVNKKDTHERATKRIHRNF